MDHDEYDPVMIRLSGGNRFSKPNVCYGLTVHNLIFEIGRDLGRWDWSNNMCEYLPTRVLWHGMLVNTLVMSLLISSPWTGLAAFRHARVLHRRRHGRCAKCGYSLAGLPAAAPCPECGDGKAQNAAIGSSS